MMNSYSSHVVYSQQLNFLYVCPLNYNMNYTLYVSYTNSVFFCIQMGMFP